MFFAMIHCSGRRPMASNAMYYQYCNVTGLPVGYPVVVLCTEGPVVLISRTGPFMHFNS